MVGRAVGLFFPSWDIYLTASISLGGAQKGRGAPGVWLQGTQQELRLALEAAIELN